MASVTYAPRMSSRFRGLLETWGPLEAVPPGHGWHLVSGNHWMNVWVKLPPRASKTARRTLKRLVS
jgi:hypothetical protein